MNDVDFSPLACQVLCNQPPVAMLVLVLAAQQAGACKAIARKRILDPAAFHQLEELLLEHRPLPLLLFVRFEQLLCWGQLWQVGVVDATKRLQEVSQVVLLGKACQLRVVVQPDVDHFLHAGLLQARKKGFGGRFGEANCKNFH